MRKKHRVVRFRLADFRCPRLPRRDLPLSEIREDKDVRPSAGNDDNKIVGRTSA
jgi:hypothetical protein